MLCPHPGLSSGSDIPAHITFSPIHPILQGTDAVSIVASLYSIRHGYRIHALERARQAAEDKYILSSDCSEVHLMAYIDLVFHRLTRILAFSNTFGGVRIVPTCPIRV
jgi:hypothetical protein